MPARLNPVGANGAETTISVVDQFAGHNPNLALMNHRYPTAVVMLN